MLAEDKIRKVLDIKKPYTFLVTLQWLLLKNDLKISTT